MRPSTSGFRLTVKPTEMDGKPPGTAPEKITMGSLPGPPQHGESATIVAPERRPR